MQWNEKKSLIIFSAGVIAPELAVLFYNKFYHPIDIAYTFQNVMLFVMLASGVSIALINLILIVKNKAKPSLLALGLFIASLGTILYASGMLVILAAFRNFNWL